jgi:hypothetical protein
MRWFIIFLLVDIASFGQKVIEGKVLDKETTKPIPFASVGILGMPRGTSTNSDGEFSLAVPDTFSIKITCIGYKSLLLRSTDDFKFIELVPAATQLNEVVVHSKKANPSKIVRKAFASIRDNYDDESFLQKFFYRQYSKTDETCERFIEASVDVWKQHGFRTLRVAAGEKEAMRINQLRRSLDITGMVQGQTPIFLDYVLQADIAAYQTRLPSDHLKMFDAVSNLKTDFSHYQFTFAGITVYDGQEVYKIKYESLADSILTSTGYIDAPRVSGSLHITTDTYAFLKTEEVREDGTNTVRTSGYYLKHKDKYYPYHFVRESENHFKNSHFFHVELMAVEIKRGEKDSFPGSQLNREDLLSIPFDSTYWSTSTILKTTPLEEGLIRCLGGGNSLNKQFHLYKQYEQNVTNGGVEGEKKFNWLVNDSKGKRNLYICFWTSDFKSYLIDMEYFKRLNQVYKNKITFVLVSLETDEQRWRQLVKNYNYFADGMINYRIGTSSETGKKYNIKKAPVFILISKDGEVELNARPPSDPMLETDLINLIGKSK